MKKNFIYGTMYFIYNIIFIWVCYLIFIATDSIMLKVIVIVYGIVKGIIQMILYYYGFIRSVIVKNEMRNSNFEEVKNICYNKYTIKSYVYEAVEDDITLQQRVIKNCNVGLKRSRYKHSCISIVGFVFVGLCWSWDMACCFILPAIIETGINYYRVKDENKALELLKENLKNNYNK